MPKSKQFAPITSLSKGRDRLWVAQTFMVLSSWTQCTQNYMAVNRKSGNLALILLSQISSQVESRCMLPKKRHRDILLCPTRNRAWPEINHSVQRFLCPTKNSACPEINHSGQCLLCPTRNSACSEINHSRQCLLCPTRNCPCSEINHSGQFLLCPTKSSACAQRKDRYGACLLCPTRSRSCPQRKDSYGA